MEKESALFIALIKTALAWVEAAIDWTKIPGAIMATAQSAIIAATPIPEFFEGGYTGNGGNLDSNGGFLAKLHKDEFVVNAKAMQNPLVNEMTKAIESGQINNITNTNISNHASSGGSDRVEQLLEHLVKNGVHAEMVFDDERLTKLGKKQAKLQTQDNLLSI